MPALPLPPPSATGRTPAPIGVVLVNWNRWSDTIEALESLLRSTVPLRIVVVDNASADGSLDAMIAWAQGQQAATPAAAAMAALSQPPVAKPLRWRRLGPGELAGAVSGGEDGITFVDSGANLGFAGGNNIGLRLLLTDPAIRWFWLLNNDTVVDPGAAAAINDRMAATDRVGMCGTAVRFYWRPDRWQALNGYRFNVWTGGARAIMGGAPVTTPYNPREVAQTTDFVLGASLVVSRGFLDTVGLMEERYFLYYEEIDWAFRNDGRFATAFAHAATVYHKEGGSIGSSSVRGGRSAGADYWHTRSRLRFIALHRPVLLPWHWLFTVGIVGRRLLRRQPDKARAVLKALFGRPL